MYAFGEFPPSRAAYILNQASFFGEISQMCATNLPVKLSFDKNPLSFEKKSLRFFRKLKDFCWKSCWILAKRGYSAAKGIFRWKCYDPLTCYYLECAVSIEFWKIWSWVFVFDWVFSPWVLMGVAKKEAWSKCMNGFSSTNLLKVSLVYTGFFFKIVSILWYE